MDRSANPWRVVDDAAVPGAAEPGVSQGPSGPDPAPRALPVRLVAGIAVAVVLVVASFGIAASGSTGGGVTVEGGGGLVQASTRPAPAPTSGGAGELVVDVQGAVPRPGIHRIPAGSRVADAIAAAGGYGSRVDAQRAGRELNLAAEVHDGDRILVPSRDDPPGTAGGGPGSGGGGGSGGGSGSGTGGALVDLNHATASELDALPGVGPVTAQKIIAAREEQAFATIEALRDRKVVGAAAFEKLKDLVTVTR